MNRRTTSTVAPLDGGGAAVGAVGLTIRDRKGIMYELSTSEGRLIATSTAARPLLDAAVLGNVRFGQAYWIHDVWTADGRHGAAGITLRKVRYGVDADGHVWRTDDSGVPSTIAASAALYLDDASQHSRAA